MPAKRSPTRKTPTAQTPNTETPTTNATAKKAAARSAAQHDGKPRRFSLHWGDGVIAEEARVSGEHHDPALQLLRFDDGAVQVRFCYYNKRGQFQRSPLILGPDDISALRDELKRLPELRRLLKQLVA